MLLSSRQAAVLLDTHESSVKRWCNAGELICETTEGGHRRIQLDTLGRFARSGGLRLDFLVFEEDQHHAVEGVLQLRRGKVSADLLDTVKKWLLDAQSYKVSALVRLARKFDVKLQVLYDQLIGGVLRDVGDSWASGAFQVGEEHRISEAILDVLYGQQAEAERRVKPDAPAAVLGAVRDEEHVTGAMMVRTLLTEAGWNVAYLGRNVPDEDFLLFQRKVDAPLLCLSATVSRTPEAVVRTINRLFEMGHKSDDFHVAVGGSGAMAAYNAVDSLSHPERVHFFDTATEFAAWADSFLTTHVLVEDETH